MTIDNHLWSCNNDFW